MVITKDSDLDSKVLGTEIVKIYVGPEKKLFSIHKELICAKSEFFKKAFKGNFQESNAIMYMPEDQSSAFDTLMVFLYRDRFPHFPSEKFPAFQDGAIAYHNVLYPFYLLAEKLCINELQNKIIDKLQDVSREFEIGPTVLGLRNYYTDTNENSKLRKYGTAVVCYWTRNVRESCALEYAEFVKEQPDFGADYLAFMCKYGRRLYRKPSFDPRLRDLEMGVDPCLFHKHAPGEVCHLAQK